MPEQQVEEQPVAQGNFTEEEPPVPPVRMSGNSDPKFYTEDDLTKAREQEKAKMYRRLETLQETVARLEEESRKRLQEQQDQEREAAEAERLRRESEMSAKDLIALREAEWKQEQESLRAEIEAERALRLRETEYAQLVAVHQDIVNEYADRVAPELLDLISGNTEEEMRQSAEIMAAKTERILAQTQEAMQNARQQMPTARVTMPMASDDSGAQRPFTPEDIRGMSMSEYAKNRARLLGGGAGGPRNRGLFG